MVKKVSFLCSVVLIVSIGGYGIYEWIAKKELNASTILFFSLGVGFLFQSLTWGTMKGKRETEKDEREKHITLVSSKISYYLLLVLMLVILFITEGVRLLNEIKNIPLVVAIGLAIAIQPMVEFIVSRKKNN